MTKNIFLRACLGHQAKIATNLVISVQIMVHFLTI